MDHIRTVKQKSLLQSKGGTFQDAGVLPPNPDSVTELVTTQLVTTQLLKINF
jgi:hypothetical protein